MRESRVTLVKREREEIQDPTVKLELKDLKAQREVRAQEVKLDPQDHSEIKEKLAPLDLLVTQVDQVKKERRDRKAQMEQLVQKEREDVMGCKGQWDQLVPEESGVEEAVQGARDLQGPRETQDSLALRDPSD